MLVSGNADRIIIYSAKTGNVELLESLDRRYYIRRTNLMTVFNLSCEKGHIDVLTWLYVTYNVQEDVARGNNYNYAFRKACQNGHMTVAQWLNDTFDLQLGSYSYGKSLCGAAESGHLEIVKWLCTDFESSEFIQAIPVAFTHAYGNAQIHVTTWLSKMFHITYNKGECVLLALKAGNVFLASAAFPEESLQADHPMIIQSVRNACINGDLHVLQFLHQKVVFTKDDACSFGTEPFISACAYGHLHVVAWLYSIFDFMLFFANEHLLEQARNTKHPHVASWLQQHLPDSDQIVDCWEELLL